ncbi:MAG: helix-turn-helix transcriptional regulator [Phycisphaeraceae bacterium]|nr:helix-turn-helix transcriptional regulator [Phycisphaerales bacterium]MCB9844283.1 helix-turn-helix transcriptional regulator [Phycisphaeraceae bacterium]
MITGHHYMLILYSLFNTDRSAPEIIEHVRATSRVRLPLSGIYNQMKRLEEQGLVRSFSSNAEVEARGGRKRRVYKLTGLGRRCIDQCDAVKQGGLNLA